MLCSKQVDEIGKECLDKQQYTYLYKGKVDIPPLSMVDDVILFLNVVTKQTAMANAYMVEEQNVDNENEIKDICLGEEAIEEKDEEELFTKS